MNCKQVIQNLPEYLENSLSNQDLKMVEIHLSNCKSCVDELDKLKMIEEMLSQVNEAEPPKQLQFSIQQMIEDEKKSIQLSLKDRIDRKHISLSIVLKVAAGLLLLITGGFIGYNIKSIGNSSDEVLGMKQEMVEMKNLVILSLIKQESASERIKAVSYIKEISQPDPKLIETLFNTLNTDRNVNVRLAAAQALSKYQDNQEISGGIVKSLETQTEPLVQIMLINLAVQSGNSDAAPELTKLLQRSDLMDEVKVYAKKGIQSLTI